MKTINIRGLDPSLNDMLKKAAKKEGKSVNQFVLDMLRTHLGVKKEKKFTREYHDMDHLFGKWSAEEYNRIQGKIDSERTIDDELWK